MVRKSIIAALFVVVAQAVSLNVANAYDPWFMGAGLGYAAGAYGYGFGGYGAQTPYSAEATGMANLVRAQGMYNESTSRATVNYEQARKQYIENQQQAYAARMSVKRMAHAESVKNQEEARAQVARADEFQAAHRPPPLSSMQLDPATGALNWPITLRLPDFDMQRKALEELFAKRSKYGPTTDSTTQISLLAGELKDSLRSHITKVPLLEYSESRQFLDSMISSVK